MFIGMYSTYESSEDVIYASVILQKHQDIILQKENSSEFVFTMAIVWNSAYLSAVLVLSQALVPVNFLRL